MNLTELFITSVSAILFALLVLVTSNNAHIALGVLIGCIIGALAMAIYKMDTPKTTHIDDWA